MEFVFPVERLLPKASCGEMSCDLCVLITKGLATQLTGHQRYRPLRYRVNDFLFFAPEPSVLTSSHITADLQASEKGRSTPRTIAPGPVSFPLRPRTKFRFVVLSPTNVPPCTENACSYREGKLFAREAGVISSVGHRQSLRTRL